VNVGTGSLETILSLGVGTASGNTMQCLLKKMFVVEYYSEM